MGVFRDHFHWRALATWPIGAISILLAVAGVLRYGEQFVAAGLFFVAAAIAMLIRVISAAVASDHSKANRIVFGIVCSVLVIAVAVFMIVVTLPKAQSELQQAQAGGVPPEGGRGGAPPASSQPDGGVSGTSGNALGAKGGGGREGAEAQGAEVRAVGPEPSTPKSGPARLFVDCRMGTLPAKVPESGRIFALVPQEFPEENGGGGLGEYFGTPGTEWTFGKWPQWAYRCDLTNYSGEILVDVTVNVGLTLVRPIPVPEQNNAYKQGHVTLQRGWQIVIAKIDAGARDPFAFYVHNCCLDRFVYVKFPPKARARRGAELVDVEIQQSATNLYAPLNPISLSGNK
jgi:hypothetical protein